MSAFADGMDVGREASALDDFVEALRTFGIIAAVVFLLSIAAYFVGMGVYARRKAAERHRVHPHPFN